MIASDDNDDRANHAHLTNVVYADAHVDTVDVKEYKAELPGERGVRHGRPRFARSRPEEAPERLDRGSSGAGRGGRFLDRAAGPRLKCPALPDQNRDARAGAASARPKDAFDEP